MTAFTTVFQITRREKEIFVGGYKKMYTQTISFKSDVYVRNTKIQENTVFNESSSVKRLKISFKHMD